MNNNKGATMIGQLNTDGTYTINLSHEQMLEMEKAMKARDAYWAKQKQAIVDDDFDDPEGEETERLEYYESRQETCSELAQTLYKIRRQK